MQLLCEPECWASCQKWRTDMSVWVREFILCYNHLQQHNVHELTCRKHRVQVHVAFCVNTLHSSHS